MTEIDIESLLREVSSDAPCGEDPEYDSDFGELERTAEGKPEQQYGDTVVPAEEPEWGAVKKQAQSLFVGTKDLRVARYLIEALLHTDGIDGLHDGLALFRGLLEKYWKGIHPQLDPDDDNDPTMRINIISSLTDSSSILLPLNTTPLVSSRAMGRFSLRDIDIATGNQPLPENSDTKPPELSAIEAAFMDAPLDELQEIASSIASSLDHLRAIDATLIEQVGAGVGPDLNPLCDILKHAQRELNQRLEPRIYSETPSEVIPDNGEMYGEPIPAGATPVRSTTALSGEVNSRDEAIHAMDKICAYYKRHEPSSPIPLLIQRAKRLSTMDFMTIMRDLAPDGISQMETIKGDETDG